ncbi:glyoxylate/hydroxypyruvate reductase A [Novosphingobium sp. RL4]|uniref:2-hydroxyacid dehydrogenase n=1 Tax=Novosphingobium sp. RL4 TaxID=3109595 RepID=UPI002D79DF88|nr:glyoxylate/hydroxypyruvate reductase A [Novosphingobium sp. RL4]WRT96059.1 glyoxylate/hydroxypyruvate reductase A [Novosphingobium sp. RL4]
MIAILHVGPSERASAWQAEFRHALPEVEFRCWPEIGDARDIRYLVAWTLSPQLIAALPRLEVLFSIGAGIDQLDLSLVPEHVRIVRMIEPGITTTMAQYVAASVLALHRDLPFYIEAQRRGGWTQLPTLLCEERSVGVMGLGELGRAALTMLAPLGFRLRGWNRSPRRIEGAECFSGAGELDAFLGGTDILVCLLPLTDETRGILSRDLFDRLPHGARLVNAARGGHLVEDDLLAALDEGRIASAMLDVSQVEPLPQDHPFRTDPRILVTPHVAGVTRIETAVHALIENLRRDLAGQALPGEVDRKRGY